MEAVKDNDNDHSEEDIEEQDRLSVPREGKRFAKPGRIGSNLRRANAREELVLESKSDEVQKKEAGPSESVSALDSSSHSNYDDKDDEFSEEQQDSKDQELDHEKKQGARFAVKSIKSSNLSRHNVVDRLPTVKIEAA